MILNTYPGPYILNPNIEIATGLDRENLDDISGSSWGPNHDHCGSISYLLVLQGDRSKGISTHRSGLVHHDDLVIWHWRSQDEPMTPDAESTMGNKAWDVMFAKWKRTS